MPFTFNSDQLDTEYSSTSRAESSRIIIKNFIKLTLAGLFIGFFHSHDFWIGLVLAIYLIYSLAKRWKRNADDKMVFLTGTIIGGVLGVCCEIWGVFFGYWEYHDLSLGRSFPYWLPFAWALAFTYIYQLEKDLISALSIKKIATKILLSIVIAMIFPTFGEIITINLGVWTYYWPLQVFGVPLLAIFLLVVFHTGVNFLMVLICKHFGWKNTVFNP
ncbi:hypothetical protein [Cyclobacterium amurskyense]|uniref:Uncharacterized protein n=1 Tax=Cyclobacterium amurskyense TaxID=320787 RepID=A0A0H4PEZ0_9BACT|nr:hypothetical protein [Cyclobacterium amurskyense]AKP52829.1 hypothetical protein CA2015_3440 [Cyclobacterium amurskyense]